MLSPFSSSPGACGRLPPRITLSRRSARHQPPSPFLLRRASAICNHAIMACRVESERVAEFRIPRSSAAFVVAC